MSRLRLLIIQALCLHLIFFSPSLIAGNASWDQFKRQFLSIDGRIIDNGNANITHTEGQGMAMLMAVYADDQNTFDQIWSWTKSNLQVREDKLFAWSWSESMGIKDFNNASDGDLFIAWALRRAYKKWNRPEYLSAALEISQAIRLKLIKDTSDGTIIIPGVQGFERPNGFILNLSYWVFPAIDELNEIDPSPQWINLKKTGIKLLQKAKFGQWQLPPDWLLTGNQFQPAMNKRFGYDAVRIPLYLIWGKVATVDLLMPYQRFWGSFRDPDYLPSGVDLINNEPGKYNASMGFHNIAKLTLAYPSSIEDGLLWPDASQNYYSYMLSFFSQLALEDIKK